MACMHVHMVCHSADTSKYTYTHQPKGGHVRSLELRTQLVTRVRLALCYVWGLDEGADGNGEHDRCEDRLRGEAREVGFFELR